MVKLSLGIMGDQEQVIERTLIRWKDNLLDLEPAWDNLNDFFAAIMDRHFEEQGAGELEDGWAALSPVTDAYKAARDLDPRILHATYRLRRSLAETTNSEHLYMAWADRMIWGTMVPYFKYHQSSEARAKLPRRQPIALSDESRKSAVKRVQAHVTGSFMGGDVL